MGHQNRKAMAHVGVRAQRRVRLGSEVEGLRENHFLGLWGLTSHVNSHSNACTLLVIVPLAISECLVINVSIAQQV